MKPDGNINNIGPINPHGTTPIPEDISPPDVVKPKPADPGNIDYLPDDFAPIEVDKPWEDRQPCGTEGGSQEGQSEQSNFHTVVEDSSNSGGSVTMEYQDNFSFWKGVYDLGEALENNPALAEQFANDPMAVLESLGMGDATFVNSNGETVSLGSLLQGFSEKDRSNFAQLSVDMYGKSGGSGFIPGIITQATPAINFEVFWNFVLTGDYVGDSWGLYKPFLKYLGAYDIHDVASLFSFLWKANFEGASGGWTAKLIWGNWLGTEGAHKLAEACLETVGILLEHVKEAPSEELMETIKFYQDVATGLETLASGGSLETVEPQSKYLSGVKQAIEGGKGFIDAVKETVNDVVDTASNWASEWVNDNFLTFIPGSGKPVGPFDTGAGGGSVGYMPGVTDGKYYSVDGDGRLGPGDLSGGRPYPSSSGNGAYFPPATNHPGEVPDNEDLGGRPADTGGHLPGAGFDPTNKPDLSQLPGYDGGRISGFGQYVKGSGGMVPGTGGHLPGSGFDPSKKPGGDLNLPKPGDKLKPGKDGLDKVLNEILGSGILDPRDPGLANIDTKDPLPSWPGQGPSNAQQLDEALGGQHPAGRDDNDGEQGEHVCEQMDRDSSSGRGSAVRLDNYYHSKKPNPESKPRESAGGQNVSDVPKTTVPNYPPYGGANLDSNYIRPRPDDGYEYREDDSGKGGGAGIFHNKGCLISTIVGIALAIIGVIVAVILITNNADKDGGVTPTSVAATASTEPTKAKETAADKTKPTDAKSTEAETQKPQATQPPASKPKATQAPGIVPIATKAPQTEPGEEATDLPAEHVHDWSVIDSLDAGCEDEGYVLYECEGCGETRSETIPALGHSWKNRTETLVEEDGSTHEVVIGKYCTRCGVEE